MNFWEWLQVLYIDCFIFLECKNKLPDDYKCTWTCDQWSGIGGRRYNYCNHDWSSKKYCVQNTTGKIKDFCQISCNNSDCISKKLSKLSLNDTNVSTCEDKLPEDYLSKCSWTCEDWAGKNSRKFNYCDHDWSTKRTCVPNSYGLIKDSCRFSCNNCGK